MIEYESSRHNDRKQRRRPWRVYVLIAADERLELPMIQRLMKVEVLQEQEEVSCRLIHELHSNWIS